MTFNPETLKGLTNVNNEVYFNKKVTFFSNVNLESVTLKGQLSSSGPVTFSDNVTFNSDVTATDVSVQNVNVGGDVTVANVLTAGSVSDSSGSLRKIPQNAQTNGYTLVASDEGKHISITTGGVTVPSGIFSIGDVVTIFNNSSNNQTITQGANVTLRQVGTTNTGNRTLLSFGLATIICVESNVFAISGAGLI